MLKVLAQLTRIIINGIVKKREDSSNMLPLSSPVQCTLPNQEEGPHFFGGRVSALRSPGREGAHCYRPLSFYELCSLTDVPSPLLL